MNIDIRYFIGIVTIFFAMCVTSCTEEISPQSHPEPSPGLTLYVPALNNFKSRSTNVGDEELKYTSLFFFAFPVDGSSPTIVPLPVIDSPLAFEYTYKKYTMALPSGKYRFYIVANLYDADADVTQLPQSESELKNARHHLPEKFDCRIPEKGLPMSAMHTDFRAGDNGGTPSRLAADGYNYDGKGTNLFATLSFLYAKITVTANDAFGFPTSLKEVKFENLSQHEPILFDNNFKEYGKQDILPAESEDTDISIVRTFYIPERQVEEPSSGEQSSLNFKIDGKQVTLPLGEAEYDLDDNTNTVPSVDTHRKIVRGTHYKYTLNTLADIRLDVAEWSPEKIMAEIDGPVYLHVEKQTYEVKTGEITEIWFKSDVDDVYLESPIYSLNENTPDWKDIPLYEFVREYSPETEEGILKISVNEDIPYSEYDKILDNADKYSFFHIVAGPIHKRIGVSPLSLGYFINVSPTSVPIDVSLRIASGEYEGKIPVAIHTNYPDIGISLSSESDWNTIYGNNTDDAFLKLLAPDNSEITEESTGNISVGALENVTINIIYKGLNAGSDIWKNKRSLKFFVEGIDGENRSVPVPVTITITPLIQDYKIHFKADGWSNPHIYVYECLEFPADWRGTYSPAAGQPEEYLASKPIGYKSLGAYFAALEYSFTGAISFQGWDVPANKDMLYLSNGTPKPFEGYKSQGFYIFSDQATWVVENKERAKVRYNYDMDFCEQYRQEISAKCNKCLIDKNLIWPGIRMKEEDDGWFVFELTGIAEPGKALIMFADGHNGNANLKYPGTAEVGIPLFDFPSKEGWLYYNGTMTDRVNNQFRASKPE